MSEEELAPSAVEAAALRATSGSPEVAAVSSAKNEDGSDIERCVDVQSIIAQWRGKRVGAEAAENQLAVQASSSVAAVEFSADGWHNAADEATPPKELEDGVVQEEVPGVPEEQEPLPPVQVCIRVRPLLDWEKVEGLESTALQLSKQDGYGEVVLKPRSTGEDTARKRNFRFNNVFGEDNSQEDVYMKSRVEGLVGKVVSGFHATVFAYGQTGSGKTFTMEGFNYNHHNGTAAPSVNSAKPNVKLDAQPEQFGLIPRAVAALFSQVAALSSELEKQGTQHQWSVRVSFLQIYKEKVFDLLNPAHIFSNKANEETTGLRLRWDGTKNGFFVENLFEFECANAEEVMRHYTTGARNKQMASTAMNVASSRSHTVLMLSLSRTYTSEGNDAVKRQVFSRLSLVDLAGSERASATTGCTSGTTRFQEAVNINQSLFVLRKVIASLSKKVEQSENGGDASIHVPYRESKLTSLLQNAIGGNSYMLMMACLNPADRSYEENLSTLKYAEQASSIKNKPVVNLDPKDRLIHKLQAQLAAAHAYILKITGLSELPEELRNAGELPTRGGHQGGGAKKRNGSKDQKRRPKSCGPEARRRREESPPGQVGREQEHFPQEPGDTGSFPRTPRAAGRQDGGRAPSASSTGSRFRPDKPDKPSRSSVQNVYAAYGVPQPPDVRKRPSSKRTASTHVSSSATPSAASTLRDSWVHTPPQSQPFDFDALIEARPSTDVLLAAALGQVGGSCGGFNMGGSSGSFGGSEKRERCFTPRRPGVEEEFPWPPTTPSSASRQSHQRPPSMPSPRSGPPRPPELPQLPGSGHSSRSMAAVSSMRAVLEAQPPPQQQLPRTPSSSSRRGPGRPQSSRQQGPSVSEPSSPSSHARMLSPMEHVEPPGRPPATALASVAAEFGDQSRSQGGGCGGGGSGGGGSRTSTPAVAADGDIHSGLWEAVEELKQGKSNVEGKLRMAEEHIQELQAELLRCQAAGGRLLAADQVRPATSTGVPTIHECSPSVILEFSATTNSAYPELDASDNEASDLANSFKGGKMPAALESEAGLKWENEQLRRDRAALQEKLDVFYDALEITRNADSGGVGHKADSLESTSELVAASGDKASTNVNGLGDLVEKLHSQLVMEAVGLRKEVAGLKRKKWVLRSVLARGGENEKSAIDHEIAQLRRARGGRTAEV